MRRTEAMREAAIIRGFIPTGVVFEQLKIKFKVILTAKKSRHFKRDYRMVPLMYRHKLRNSEALRFRVFPFQRRFIDGASACRE